jgi:hypothetical protein
MVIQAASLGEQEAASQGDLAAVLIALWASSLSLGVPHVFTLGPMGPGHLSCSSLSPSSG